MNLHPQQAIAAPDEATVAFIRAMADDAVKIAGGKAIVVKDDKAIATPVVTGEKLGEMTEIKSGVAAGDRVVMRPPDKLRDGSRIAAPAR